jgi:hypothetical protein
MSTDILRPHIRPSLKDFPFIRRGSIWSPPNVQNLALWLDASDPASVLRDTGSGFVPALDTQAVARWVDKSSNAHILLRNTVTARPTLSTSTGPSGGREIVFSGTNQQCLIKHGLVFDLPCTVFLVMRQISVTDLRSIWDTRANGARPGMVQRTGGFLRNVGGNLPNPGPSQTTGTWNLISFWQDTANVSIQKDDETATTAANPVVPSGADSLILAARNATNNANIGLAAVVAYSRILTVEERAKVRSFLKSKYGTP